MVLGCSRIKMDVPMTRFLNLLSIAQSIANTGIGNELGKRCVSGREILKCLMSVELNLAGP